MKKQSLLPVLAVLSFLSCAFSGSPAAAKAGDESAAEITITTKVKSDGSGVVNMDFFLSKTLIDLLDLTADFSKDELCDEMEGFDWTQKERDNGISCVAEEPFADLKELEDFTEDNFSGAAFDRLEIEGDRFYYDLKAVYNFADDVSGGLGLDVKAWWVVEAPGKVVSSNAQKTDGRTLTWDLLRLKAGDHLRVESELGGPLGVDPAVAALVGILMLGCCCLVVIIAGVAVFFFLRRKK